MGLGPTVFPILVATAIETGLTGLGALGGACSQFRRTHSRSSSSMVIIIQAEAKHRTVSPRGFIVKV